MLAASQLLWKSSITSAYVMYSSHLKRTHLRCQVLVDGPSKDAPVPRHSAPLSNVILTPIVLKKLPLAIGHGPLTKVWEKEEVESKWKESGWAKSKARREKRKNLSDFERFKAMRLRKQVCFTCDWRYNARLE
jgi:ribosomal protein L14E/L6E/L27E